LRPLLYMKIMANMIRERGPVICFRQWMLANRIPLGCKEPSDQHFATVAVEDEGVEKALGGAAGSSKLGSWRRMSARGAGLGLPLGGRGGLLPEFWLLSPGPAPSPRLSSQTVS
jgi:hypothetical protein